jgi:ATP-dependent DNA helicase RecG
LASAFFKGGLIEAWGRGTIKIINECEKAGLPEPIIENVFGGIQVTLFKNQLDKTKLVELGLNNRQIKAIEYLKENIKITNSVYRQLVDTSEKTAYRDLDDLVTKGILIKQGDKKGSFYTLNV